MICAQGKFMERYWPRVCQISPIDFAEPVSMFQSVPEAALPERRGGGPRPDRKARRFWAATGRTGTGTSAGRRRAGRATWGRRWRARAPPRTRAACSAAASAATGAPTTWRRSPPASPASLHSTIPHRSPHPGLELRYRATCSRFHQEARHWRRCQATLISGRLLPIFDRFCLSIVPLHPKKRFLVVILWSC